MNNGIQIITRATMQSEIEKLKVTNPNLRMWSISKINNFNTCKRGFFYTYIDKKDQKTGIYSFLGSACHGDLENLYEDEKETELKDTNFSGDCMKAKMFGINFMSDNVEKNYLADIREHYKQYRKPNGKFLSEIGFILKIDENNYMQGYIDLIKLNDDGTVEIVDFKTSSKFDKKKLFEGGRQLSVYQMALEQLYGMEVVSNGWQMLKYVSVQVGDYKAKDVSAREWVAKCSTQIKNLNKKEKYVDEGLIDMLLSKCETDNSIELLPQKLKDRINVKTCFVGYDVTDEIKKETMEYILNTVSEIEELDKGNEKEWDRNVNEFWCKNLCGFSGKHCRYWEYR